MNIETEKNKYEAIYCVSERLNWVFVISGGRPSTRLVGVGEKLKSHFSPNSGEKPGKTTTGLSPHLIPWSVREGERKIHQADKMMSLQREPRTCCDVSF